jgi:caa(3)-type oxidase subunit IV
MSAHDHTALKRHIRVYTRVFLALMVATVLTVGVSYIHFGSPESHVGNIAVALVIAVAKAGLVAAFFMHLAAEKRSIYTVLTATVVFFAGLMTLTVWAAQDLPELSAPTVPRPAPHSAPAHDAHPHVP